MSKTIKRQPFSVSTSSNAYPKERIFNQVDFKGISDTKNDVLADPFSFASAKNVYIDENNLLVSRAPFKFSDEEAHIIKQWTFDEYTLRLQRFLVDEKGDLVNNPQEVLPENLYYLFTLRCTSHETEDIANENVFGSYTWKFSVSDTGFNFEPKMFMAHIEEKIFFWFCGTHLIAFNFTSREKPFFEDARKYLYIPIKELIIGTLPIAYEDENFLTESFRRRHQRSALSSIDFNSLKDKNVDVRITDESGGDEILYDFLIRGEHSLNVLVYPYSIVGEDYHIDMVETDRSFVIMRYSNRTENIEISFDGKSFRSLPKLEGMLGKPLLTRDGLNVIAFRSNDIAVYKVVAQDSSDFSETSENFWTSIDYIDRSTEYEGKVIPLKSSGVYPVGWFRDLDYYAYAFVTKTDAGEEISFYNRYGEGAYFTRIPRIYPLLPSPNILDPNESLSGYYDTANGEIAESVNHRRIKDVIYTKEHRYLYLRANTELNDDTADYAIAILFYDEWGTYLSHAYNYLKNQNDSKTILIPENTYYIRAYINHAQNGNSLDDWCISFEKLDKFIPYGNIDTDLFPSNQVNVAGSVMGNHSIMMSMMLGEPNADRILFITSMAGINSKEENDMQILLLHHPIGDDYLLCGAEKFDHFLNVSEQRVDKIDFSIRAAYSKFSSEKNAYCDSIFVKNVSFDASENKLTSNSKNVLAEPASNEFVFNENTGDLITDSYWLSNSNTIVYIPEKIRSASNVPLRNLDKIKIVDGDKTYDLYIHRLSSDGKYLSDDDIHSGDVISTSSSMFISEDNLVREFLYQDKTGFGNRWYIEKLTIDDATNAWRVVSGNIKTNDIIRLRAYDKQVTYEFGDPVNPTNDRWSPYSPTTYPSPPDGWQVGDDWPREWLWNKPWKVNGDGTIDYWQAGDVLPTGGRVELYGIIEVGSNIRPVYSGQSNWWLIDGKLWTNSLNSNVTINIDEYVNCNEKDAILNSEVPTHHESSENEYFSFISNDRRHLLEISNDRRNDEGLLLYLPKGNEQALSEEITNFCPLTKDTMGIFTQNSVWYVMNRIVNDALVYTKAAKSKIPFGCRSGDDVTIALDGQAILLPTIRGIAVMKPEMFLSDTEQSLSYLSDSIYGKYERFFRDNVLNSSIVLNGTESGYSPAIKIATYKYWILFYKYFDNEIFMFDTRNASWWNITTPYPIRQLDANDRLYAIMQIDYSPMKGKDIVFPTTPPSLDGVPFIFADYETRLIFEESEFPVINDEVMKYNDDVVDKTLSGSFDWKYENEFVGSRRILRYASPIIDWHFTSQKLHFDQVNNYKRIKNITLNLKGTDTTAAKLSTKVFRDFYHPEQSDVIEMKVNDVGMFTKNLNSMHVINFQYKLENDESIKPHQLKLNGVSIKHEVKEKVR